MRHALSFRQNVGLCTVEKEIRGHGKKILEHAYMPKNCVKNASCQG